METKDGKLICLDAKMNFDGNALYRHPEIVELRDLAEEDPAEIEASKHDLPGRQADGDIGCMVNGAGLAMATMDIIKLYGAEPANFLDVGGGASKRKRCRRRSRSSRPGGEGDPGQYLRRHHALRDIIADGVIAAAREMAIEVPLVVRLEGTNAEFGKKILSGSAEGPACRRPRRRRAQDHRRGEQRHNLGSTLRAK